MSGNLDDDDNDLLIRPGWPGTSIRSQRGKKACLLPLRLSFSLSSRGKVVFVPGRWHVSFLFAAATRRTRSMEQDGEEQIKEDEERPELSDSLLHTRQTSYTPPSTVNFIFVDGTDG